MNEHARPAAWISRAGPYLLCAVAGSLLTLGLTHVFRAPALKPAPASAGPARPDPLSASAADYAWLEAPEPLFPLPPFAAHLKDVVIVIDPGHGGRADRENWKRGPTGLREAEVNLRVALFLRDFLEQAGADVTLTRDSDVYLDVVDAEDLKRRAAVANERRADLFLSIHHNASDTNPNANFSTIFFHGNPDDSPASLGAGRHLLHGLADALRLEQHLGCGLVSDYSIYPGKGFAVLREAQVPALLVESSFHTNPDEENRLRDPLYNRREAYGLFLGLVRWAHSGLPRISLVEPEDGVLVPGKPIVVALDDGLSARGGLGSALPKAVVRTIEARLDGIPVQFEYEPRTRRLRIPTPTARGRGQLRVQVDFANIFGQTVLHPELTLTPE